jgi:hypothetical protein
MLITPESYQLRRDTTSVKHAGFVTPPAKWPRDQLHQAALKKLGWRVIVIWECECEKPRRWRN